MIRNLKKILRRKFSGRYYDPLVDPDEIFLDSKNLPEFDTQQFEGQLERPIGRRSIIAVGILFFLTVIVFGGRLWVLQVVNGETYEKLSERNSLGREPIFAPRGNIYDRNGVLLAWNDAKTEDTPWGTRVYIDAPGFSHLLGYVGYPAKDSSGNYWQTEIVGKDGVERMYDDRLRGDNGSHIVERDIRGQLQVGSVVNRPIAGENLTLAIDSRLQKAMYEYLSTTRSESGFRSASAIMMDVRNGDVIVMTNAPEYNPNIMSEGSDVVKIRDFLTNKNTPLLNRAISGLFTPGSIVKPYIALEALNQGVIEPFQKICSCGSISIPNPYDPSKPSIFRDYNPNNGWVDMRKALSVSSNIYFYEVTGGYEGQKGIGIYKLGEALERFGLTTPTGIDLFGEQSGNVPSPEWKAKTFSGEIWRVGDTYNTAIGQYGVQVTPIAMARAVGGIARGGTLVRPHVLQEVSADEKRIEDLDPSFYTVIQEGMHMGATEGTGRILSGLPFSSASKTGTAQVGVGGLQVNAWMNMYFPYKEPRYSLVIVFERGPQTGLEASQRVAKQFFDWMVLNAPEYYE